MFKIFYLINFCTKIYIFMHLLKVYVKKIYTIAILLFVLFLYQYVELENSARDKQLELENLMGVTTLKNFYSMIDETTKLTSEIKAKGITEEPMIQETFDNLFEKAKNTTGLEDKIPNWGKIVKEARILNQQ